MFEFGQYPHHRGINKIGAIFTGQQRRGLLDGGGGRREIDVKLSRAEIFRDRLAGVQRDARRDRYHDQVARGDNLRGRRKKFDRRQPGAVFYLRAEDRMFYHIVKRYNILEPFTPEPRAHLKRGFAKTYIS